MCETIRINGQDVPVDQLEGPDPEMQTAAYRRLNRQRQFERDRAAGRSVQSGIGNSLPHRGMKYPMTAGGIRVS